MGYVSAAGAAPVVGFCFAFPALFALQLLRPEQGQRQKWTRAAVALQGEEKVEDECTTGAFTSCMTEIHRCFDARFILSRSMPAATKTMHD